MKKIFAILSVCALLGVTEAQAQQGPNAGDSATRMQRMKERVKPRDFDPGGGWFDMLEKGREPANDSARVEIFRGSVEFVQRDARFLRAPGPWIRTDFRNLEFTL